MSRPEYWVGETCPYCRRSSIFSCGGAWSCHSIYPEGGLHISTIRAEEQCVLYAEWLQKSDGLYCRGAALQSRLKKRQEPGHTEECGYWLPWSVSLDECLRRAILPSSSSSTARHLCKLYCFFWQYATSSTDNSPQITIAPPIMRISLPHQIA